MRLDNFLFEGRDEDPYDVVSELYSKSLPYIMEYIKAFRPVSLKSQMLLSGRAYSDAVIDNPIRTDRSPKDTPINAHNFVDELFYKYFHVYARSASIFVTGRYSTASSYGERVYGIFPSGNDYKIIWSPDVQDLFSDVLEQDFSLVGSDDYDFGNWGGHQDDYLNDEISGELESEFESNNNVKDFESEEDYEENKLEYIKQNIDQRVDNALYDRFKAEVEDQESELSRIIKKYKDGDLKNAILSNNEIMLSGKSYIGVRYDYLPYILRYMEVHGAKKPTPHLFATAMVGINLKLFDNKSNVSFNEINKRLHKSLNSIDISDPKR